MVALITLLLVVVLSILVTRVATVALIHTGLAREAARFQARSAFSGSGFTTSESEAVVNHPIRRRIIMLLMLLGNAGLVTAVSTLLLTFLEPHSSGSMVWRFVFLVAGLVVLWALARSHTVERWLHNLISRLLKRYTKLDVRDYNSLLHLSGEYRVSELFVREGDWLAGQRLRELDLSKEGVMVLGITRAAGDYEGAPTGDSLVLAGDSLVLYGRASSFEELDQRREGWYGDRLHRKAVREQEHIEDEELAQEPQEKPGGAPQEPGP